VRDSSHRTLLAQDRKLARGISAPDFLVGAQGVTFDKDHLVSVQVVELDGADDIAVQILDAHVDAVVLKADLLRPVALSSIFCGTASSQA
jgi:hypothetical protein